jgi:hypothetical protein
LSLKFSKSINSTVVFYKPPAFLLVFGIASLNTVLVLIMLSTEIILALIFQGLAEDLPVVA